jgi:transcriptional regulator with XRE-family HTH domain
MQATQKNYVPVDARPHPANDEGVVSDQVMNLIRPMSRQQNAVYRNKVLTRRRRASKHPLRELRIKAGYTLEELADVTKMSPSYLSRLESGSRRLNADLLHRLSAALSCNPSELLTYTTPYGINLSPEAQNYVGSSNSSKDLPVYRLIGTLQNFGQINTESAEQWITRPTELSGVMGAFACVIKEANFGSKYNNGDRILLHPTAPLSQRCSVLAVTNDDKAYIGRFLNWEVTSATAAPSKLSIEVISGKPNEAQKSQKMIFDRTQLKGTYRIIGSFEAA